MAGPGRPTDGATGPGTIGDPAGRGAAAGAATDSPGAGTATDSPGAGTATDSPGAGTATGSRKAGTERSPRPGESGADDPLDPPPWIRPTWTADADRPHAHHGPRRGEPAPEAAGSPQADRDEPAGPAGGMPPWTDAGGDPPWPGGTSWTASSGPDPDATPPPGSPRFGAPMADRAGPAGTGTGTGTDGPRTDAPQADEDDLLPPAGAPRRGQLTVARLQPANVRQLVRAAPPQPAGKPPGAATAAGVLCGILAVPMLATTGALFATGSHPALAGSTFVAAILSVVGGIRLIQRGSPLLPLLCAAFSVLGGVLLVSGAVGTGVLISVLGTVWLLFTVLALIMVVLLRRRRVRRWLTARGREWQRGRPTPRRWRWRRRVHLPERLRRRPKLRLVSRLRPAQRAGRTRRPAKVKRVGRHVRGGRRPGARSGPVGFVGRDSPDRPPPD
ncbi:hypothetical protein Athai_22050 [Actinocatenispora thailandica]|uniref:Uncharacterized protein n=2 Tax=Actinocatenispora thailandica TaxID=227318 RepID=A0A7R7HW45_9ACTN|nr:hypothetical protein Athai_22050 [Actinocatenispora thailandica]